MNARVYFGLLRPVWVLAITGIYTLIGAMQIKTFLRMPADGTLFLTLAVVAPLLFGALITGPLHEVMHQGFFVLLPDARCQLRRWHVRTLAVLAGTLALVAWAMNRTMPVPAVAGCAAALMALPLLNGRGTQSGRRVLMMWTLCLLLLATIYVGGPALWTAAQAAPWSCFGVGVIVGTFCVWRGFERESVRARGGRPFQSALTGVRSVFAPHEQRAMVVRAIQEKQRRDATPGADWRGGPIDGSTRSWLRVLRHEQYGANGRAARWRSCLMVLGFTMAVPVIVSLCVIHLLDPAATWRDVFVALAKFGAPEAGPLTGRVYGFVGLLCLIPPWISCVAVFVRALPRANYPLSRRRFAWLLFLLAQRQLGIALLVQLGGALLLPWGAALASGQAISWHNVQLQLALLLVQMPFLPLLQCAAVFQRGFVRIVAALTVAAVLVATATYVFFWQLPFVLSPAGVVLSVALTALASAGYAGMVRREIGARDLDRGFGLVHVQPAL